MRPTISPSGTPEESIVARDLARRDRRREKIRRIGRLALCSLVAMTSGCGLLRKIPDGPHDTETSFHDAQGLQIEYPEVTQCAATPPSLAAQQATAPMALEDPSKIPAYDLTLEEAIHMAVEQSPVLRSIGGTIVTAPLGTATIYDPGLISASPTLGTEAALSAFDAQYTQQLFWFSDDRPNNIRFSPVINQFSTPIFQGKNATFSGDLSKQTSQGARFALRHVINYTRNNQPSRGFRSAYEGWIEAEWRQPLMQGSGTLFNRIAGPSTIPGQYNGVLIARVNEDVALADFEAALIGLVSDVELAYWDLMTAYRVLDTTVEGRAAGQKAYQWVSSRVKEGLIPVDQEAQARSQFFLFQSQVEAALGGETGLYAQEQRLRYLIGLPSSDGRIIRPTTEPIDVRVVFDWESALGQSLQRRVEVRRQRFSVQRREMELTAARLNLRPRLDFLAQYRWRGLGDHLIGPTGGGPLNNLYGAITGGRYQEAQAGIEMNFPVGLRAAGVAVSHARLNLNRERALLAETELRVSHDLSNAARQVKLTHQLLETNYNRFAADIRQARVLDVRLRSTESDINFLLQAQRQVVLSATDFYRSLGNYNLSIRDFHRQKGSLLAYNQVQLAEGFWASGAARDAHKVGRFLTPKRHPESTYVPRPLTSGVFDPAATQDTTGAGTTQIEAGAPQEYTEPIPADAATPMPADAATPMPVPAAIRLPPTADDAVQRSAYPVYSTPVSTEVDR